MRSTRASSTSGPGCRGHTTSRSRSTRRRPCCGFFRGSFDLGQDFVYGVFSADESEVLGGTGLHTRAGRERSRSATGCAQSRAGRGHRHAGGRRTDEGRDRARRRRADRDPVDPANEASCRIPRRLGYREEGVLRRRLPTADGTPRRDAVVFSLLAEELAGLAGRARRGSTAFDAAVDELWRLEAPGH